MDLTTDCGAREKLDSWISVLSLLGSFLIAHITVKNELEKEKNKGKIILTELIKRYFISCWNSWNKETGKLLTDNLTKQQYLRIVIRIEQDLLELQNNLYYSSLLEKYPSVTMVQIQLSREIAEHEDNQNFALNAGTTKKFYDLYKLIRKDLPKYYLKNPEYVKINNSIDVYIKEINKNKV